MTAFSKLSNFFRNPAEPPFFLGVAGGSGSGKTHFARAMHSLLGSDLCEIIYQDNFYLDQSKRFDKDGGAVNFDHPNSIDFSLLKKHLKTLKNGFKTEIPTYDFVTHKRPKKTVRVEPKKIIIIDGILIAHVAEVRCEFNELIFFDTPEDLRFKRRLERDVKERGRDPLGVHAQFYNQVKPMHDEFVEPSKIHAHTVVKDSGDFDRVLEDYYLKLKNITAKR